MTKKQVDEVFRRLKELEKKVEERQLVPAPPCPYPYNPRPYSPAPDDHWIRPYYPPYVHFITWC